MTANALQASLVGAILSQKYSLKRLIGTGGMGSVYESESPEDHRPLAIKILGIDYVTDVDIKNRFIEEGHTCQRLIHPNIVRVFDVGTAEDGTPYIVMELLDGENLYETYEQLGPLPWRRVVTIAWAVCSSLSEAHTLGIVHRDLKPANIHLGHAGPHGDTVKVLDFGIAKIIRGESGLDSSDLTQTGHMIGTFDYMPPEQMVGGECTGQTDIFTLGVVMYEMIAGHRPYGEHDTSTQMLAALLSKHAMPLGAFAEVPPELDRIIQRMIAREPEHRYPNVEVLAAELEGLVPRRPDVTDRMDAVTVHSLPDDLITPLHSLEDVPGDTRFEPPPIFADDSFEDTSIGVHAPEQPSPLPKKFIEVETLPGIIAPKKKP